MSITFSVTYRDKARPDLYLPVSGEAGFTDYWLKHSLELGLKYIPLLSKDLWIYKELEAQEMLNELAVLRNYLSKNYSQGHEISQRFIDRIDKLIEAIQDTINHWEEIEFISF